MCAQTVTPKEVGHALALLFRREVIVSDVDPEPRCITDVIQT